MNDVALITGGSRGIGRALVQRFRVAGYRVATCATSEAGLEGSEAELRVACDVRDAKAVAAFVARTQAALGRIDVVVNNAGIAGENPFTPDASDERWHAIIDTNLHGTYHVCKHALPHLPDRRGRIINIGSVLSLRGVPEQTAYCAAKHAVLGLTRALAHAAAPRGITVNAICPGWTRSDMATSRWAELGISEADAGRDAPLGRIVEAEEVAALALFLASAEAAAITGRDLVIDAGMLA